MYILDDHLHLQPSGRNVEAIRDFERSGGTHIVLVRFPDHPAGGDFSKSYDDTLAMAERVRSGTGVKVFVEIGPYPVELMTYERKMGLLKAVECMKRGVDLAATYVKEGKAVAIGEVGRPHFPVEDRILRASNDIMEYAMAVAGETGCAVVLHTESAGPDAFSEFALMADRAGLRREKVVKHFSPPVIDVDKNLGLFPSIIASEKNITAALAQGDRFMLESDYIDDPRRPGAVVPPATIPKKTKKLLASGLMSEESAFRVHKDNPEKAYGIIID